MMEALLKRELSTVKLVSLGSCSGGCISNAHSYEIDNGRVFVKYNTDEKVGVAQCLHQRDECNVFCRES